MGSPAKRPPERPQWHFRSVWQYIVVGLVIVVGGSLLTWGVVSVLSGDDPSEVNIPEGAEVTTTQPAAPTTTTTTEPPPAPTAGDCDRFPVYAQGRALPMGTAVRSEPTIAAPQTDSIQPNVIISVDGWVRSDAPYPTNPDPWNENVWFRLTDRSGWVSFAGVRASPSHADGTDGPAEGGWPVELLDECEIPALTKR